MNDAHQERGSDADLVAAYLLGDASALASIYDRYADSLYDTAAAMLRDRHEAADVMQDVFVVAAQRLGQLRDPSRLKPWMFAILRNEVFRRTKRRARTRPTDFAAPEAIEMAAATDPAAEGATLAADELAEIVRAAATGLDERDQLVLELTARQGLTGTDLADALGVSADQSYVLVHRMRERVERSLGALTVARMGRRDCPELATVLSGWDGTFGVLVRKRVARHIDGCDTCDDNRKKYAVIPLLSASPAFAAPIGLRELVLGRVAAQPTTQPYDFDETTGFPRPLPRSRRALIAGLVGGAAAVVLLVGGGIALTSGSDDGAAVLLAPTTTVTVGVVMPTTAPSGAPNTTTATAPNSTVPTSDAPEIAPTTTPLPSTTVLGSTASTPATPATPATTVQPAPLPTTAPVTVPPTPLPPLPPPSTTAAPLPGLLVLSGSNVDLGASSTSAAFTLSNSGQQPLDWLVSPNGASAPFATSPSAGQLAPGSSVQVQVSIDRAGQAEGDVSRGFTIASSAGGGGQLTASARVEVPPVVSVSGPTATTICPSTAPTQFTSTATDSSGVVGVVLSWSGPGASGSVTMSNAGGGSWTGAFGGAANGTWTVTATATDNRNNLGSATRSINVRGCI